jgi:HEAT repeat protein
MALLSRIVRFFRRAHDAERDARRDARPTHDEEECLPSSVREVVADGSRAHVLDGVREIERLVESPDAVAGQPVVRWLANLLHGADWELRSAAAETLAKMGRAALPALQSALRSDELDVRCDAAWAFGVIGESDAVPLLLDALENAEPRLQCFIATALSKIKDPRGVRPVVGLLASEDGSVRSTAAAALGRMGPDAVAALLAELPGADSVRRPAIIWALGELARPEALDALLGAIRSADAPTRAASASALARMAGDVRRAGRLDEFVEVLLPALEDEAMEVRQHAAFALAQTGRAAATAAAVDAMVAGLDSPISAQRAGSALVLGELGDRRALGPLQQHAANETNAVARNAMKAAIESLRST